MTMKNSTTINNVLKDMYTSR